MTSPNGPPPPARSTPTALDPAAGGGLLKASVQAAIGFAALFAALTFGPYFWDKSQAATKAAPAPAEKAEPAPEAPQPAAPPPASPDPGAKLPAGPTAGKPPNKGDILDKLGESGTKAAPKTVNPLDKKDDDILKDIK